MNDKHFKFSTSVLALPLFFVLSLWIVFWAERRFGIDLIEFGIYPRTFSGLKGIVFSPFIHGNIKHLLNNTFPLLILMAALRFFYRAQSLYVLGFGILFSGFITWGIGRNSYHIGASGLIYVLVSFIFFKGIITKYYRLVALSLTVVTFYGGMIWYVFPGLGDESVSWEGHLAGLITGFAFAIGFKTAQYQKPIKYDWESPDYDASQDKFMQRFDENGNFVNLPKEEPQEIVDSYFVSDIPVFYEFVETKNESKPES
ncbi:MAG: rhomboid family intramembrane serine protease [Flavobacterium sp.]